MELSFPLLPLPNPRTGPGLVIPAPKLDVKAQATVGVAVDCKQRDSMFKALMIPLKRRGLVVHPSHFVASPRLVPGSGPRRSAEAGSSSPDALFFGSRYNTIIIFENMSSASAGLCARGGQQRRFWGAPGADARPKTPQFWQPSSSQQFGLSKLQDLTSETWCGECQTTNSIAVRVCVS